MKKRTWRRKFEETRWSLVLRAQGSTTAASRTALAELCAIYRPPLYAFACKMVTDPERAEDMVQDFLTRLVERNVIDKAAPTRGRFRCFLKTAIKHHILNFIETEQALKRGGGSGFVDVGQVDVISSDISAEHIYNRQCAWELVGRAFHRLHEEQEARGHGAVFEVLRERLVGDDDGATLRDEAERLGVDTVTLRVRLSRLRKMFGDLVRDEVAHTVASPNDVEDELKELLEALRGPG